jgi:hypothetical protein
MALLSKYFTQTMLLSAVALMSENHGEPGRKDKGNEDSSAHPVCVGKRGHVSKSLFSLLLAL